MIEVVTVSGKGETIDRAEADSPENAVYAARTLLREAADLGYASSTTLVRFYVAGSLVRETGKP